MTIELFHALLDRICQQLTSESRTAGFTTALKFENRVREVTQEISDRLDSTLADPICSEYKNEFPLLLKIDMHPPAQGFPDIVIGDVGIEVKYTEADTWRCIANSVLETNKVHSVKHICVVYCKMGGNPEVRYDDWEHAIMHVRTSHVPRFELEIGATRSLFSIMGITYDAFTELEMSEKMVYIREYARSRLKEGEHLWWLDDPTDDNVSHTLPLNARLYTNLDMDEKTKLRAEAVLLCPQILSSGRSRHKYDDLVMFMMTYHGVLCHQARDLFSAGSAAGIGGNGRIKVTKMDDKLIGKDFDGIYILRSLLLLEDDMRKAAVYLEDKLFQEYWGDDITNKIDIHKPVERIRYWLKQADNYAQAWTPSEYLFQDLQKEKNM
jgi:hypothetical protein